MDECSCKLNQIKSKKLNQHLEEVNIPDNRLRAALGWCEQQRALWSHVKQLEPLKGTSTWKNTLFILTHLEKWRQQTNTQHPSMLWLIMSRVHTCRLSADWFLHYNLVFFIDLKDKFTPPKKFMSVISCSCRWKHQVNCRSPRTFLELRSVLLNFWSRRGRLVQHDPPGETPEILICQIDLKTTCVHFFRNFLAVVVELEVSDTGAQTRPTNPAFKPLLDLKYSRNLDHAGHILWICCIIFVPLLLLFCFCFSPVVWEKNDSS